MKTIIGLRWWIIALVCAGTIVNYLSRNALGVMAPQLTQLLHMSTKQYSYVVGAFQVGYTIMQPVCGLIIDLIGLRARLCAVRLPLVADGRAARFRERLALACGLARTHGLD